jgi:hypothetical protein
MIVVWRLDRVRASATPWAYTDDALHSGACHGQGLRGNCLFAVESHDRRGRDERRGRNREPNRYTPPWRAAMAAASRRLAAPSLLSTLATW